MQFGRDIDVARHRCSAKTAALTPFVVLQHSTPVVYETGSLVCARLLSSNPDHVYPNTQITPLIGGRMFILPVVARIPLGNTAKVLLPGV